MSDSKWGICLRCPRLRTIYLVLVILAFLVVVWTVARQSYPKGISEPTDAHNIIELESRPLTRDSSPPPCPPVDVKPTKNYTRTVDTSCTPNCKYQTHVAAKGSWIIFYSPNDHVQHTWFNNGSAVPEEKNDNFYKDAYKLYVHAVSESNDQFFYFCDISMDCAGQPFYKFIVQDIPGKPHNLKASGNMLSWNPPNVRSITADRTLEYQITSSSSYVYDDPQPIKNTEISLRKCPDGVASVHFCVSTINLVGTGPSAKYTYICPTPDPLPSSRSPPPPCPPVDVKPTKNYTHNVSTSCSPKCSHEIYVAAKESWIIFLSPIVQHTWFDKNNNSVTEERNDNFYKDAYHLYVHAVSKSNDQLFQYCDSSMDCAGQPFYKFIVQDIPGKPHNLKASGNVLSWNPPNVRSITANHTLEYNITSSSSYVYDDPQPIKNTEISLRKCPDGVASVHFCVSTINLVGTGPSAKYTYICPTPELVTTPSITETEPSSSQDSYLFNIVSCIISVTSSMLHVFCI